METPCSRQILNITENEFLGNSLRKINDNFQVLQLNVCELEFRLAALNQQLTELNIPLDPRCGKGGSDTDLCPELEKTILIPDPETCVHETREPIVNSFFNLKDTACELNTTIDTLISVIAKNVAGIDVTPPGIFNPLSCTHTDGISPSEYMGDSYDKIRANMISLKDKYCSLLKRVKTAEARIKCPPKRGNKRQTIIDRFTMQGEGGYAWNTYNFVNRDKIYAPNFYATGIQDIMGAPEYNKYKYNTTINGTQYYGLSGALRVCQAKNNQSAILRNGNVYMGTGTSRVGPFRSNWIKNNVNIMYDMFMPSTHGDGGYTQVVLLTTGNLHFLDLDKIKTNESHVPPIILSNIDRFLCINQSHCSDLIVLSNDKKVYHVGVTSVGVFASGYAYQEITNMGDTDDIAFMQIGDGFDSCYVCYKSDPTKVYQINCSVTTRNGHAVWGWFTSKSNTAKVLSVPLDPGEYFVDGCSNEFDYVFLTNYRVLCFSGYDSSYDRCTRTVELHNLPVGTTPIRMSTACSYSMAVELSDGYYLLSRRSYTEYNTGISKAPCGDYPTYDFFTKFTIWDTLIQGLTSSRPDIYGFDPVTTGECVCDPIEPPPPPEECVPERTDLLDRFAMQGEGGYHNFTFNFVDKDKIYGNQLYSANYPSILGSYLTTYNYTTSIGGKQWYALKNAIRICVGNNNIAGIFRDGFAYVSTKQYYHSWIKNTYINWKDLFMPSSYGDAGKGEISQGVLLKTGQLHALLLNAEDIAAKKTWPTSGPPVLQGLTTAGTTVDLDNIDRFLTINQAPNGDIIVAGMDDKVWHVGFARAALTSRGGSARQIKNIQASKLQCICIGDNSFSSICVFKADRTKIYKLTPSSYRDLSYFAWFTERDLAPICDGVNKTLTIGGYSIANFLQSGEYVVDVCANEFHLAILTNKNVHSFQGNASYTSHVNGNKISNHKKFTLSSGVSAVRMCTSTSYSMAVTLSDGFYLLSYVDEAGYEGATNDGSSDGLGDAYQYFSKIKSWTTLAQVLSVDRPDISPFGTSCDIPPNWSCYKTFQEDLQIMMMPTAQSVTLNTNQFYPLSSYQEGTAFLNAAGIGFTGTTTVTFRHPTYPVIADTIFTYDSDPSINGDAVITWSTGSGNVITYWNYPSNIVRVERMPWLDTNGVQVSHDFVNGIYGSVTAKQYLEPTVPICSFPTNEDLIETGQPPPCYLQLQLNTTITISYDTATDRYEVTTPDGVVHPVIPYQDKKTAADHYLYNASDASSHTGYEVSEQSRIYLYRKAGTLTPINLVINHDRPDDGSGGTVNFKYTPSLPTGSKWIAQDDGDSDSFSNTSCRWNWSPCCTDGGAIELPNGAHTFNVTSDFVSGINDWVWWESCGTGALCSRAGEPLLINASHKVRLFNVSKCVPSHITVNGHLFLTDEVPCLIILNPGGFIETNDPLLIIKLNITNNGGTIRTTAPSDLSTYRTHTCC